MRLETMKSVALLLQHVTSKDETRYHLGAVKVTPTELMATDGHILARVKHGDDEVSEEAYYHRDDLPIIKAHIKALRPDKVEAWEMVGKYPDLDALTPKAKPPKAAVAFNPELLLKLAKGMGWKKGPIVMQLDEASNGYAPIRVSYEGQVGVLMPCRAGLPALERSESDDSK